MAEAGITDFPSILGPDASFKGELTFEKGLRVHGRFEGKITSGGRLQVAREAKVQGDIEAGSIIVEGEVKGNLSANDRIELKASSRFDGDLRASKLVVEEGAVFSGNVSVGPEAGKSRPSVSVTMGSGAQRPAMVPQGQPVK
jgi:cytoskeletal protein CcmA (bactofilin family)